MFHLIIEYHVPKNEDRHEEYLTCLRENLRNPHIEKVHIFLESNRKQPPIEDSKIVYPKVKKQNVGKHRGNEQQKSYLKVSDKNRATFSDLFRYTRESLSGEKCIIANSDIFFDETLEVISEVDLGKTMICLSRWDIRKGLGGLAVKLFKRADSQDSWIFNSPVSKEIEERSNFYLGRKGCDNALAWIAHDEGMKLTNPAHQIISKHLHMVDYRTYKSYGSLLDDPKRKLDYTKVYITDDWELSRVSKNREEWEL